MARARRAPVEPEPEAPEVAVELEPSDLLDARAFIDQSIPEAIRNDAADLLHYCRRHAPGWVKSEEQGRAQADNLARHRRMWEARREARRRGLAVPGPEEFFEGFEPAGGTR